MVEIQLCNGGWGKFCEFGKGSKLGKKLFDSKQKSYRPKTVESLLPRVKVIQEFSSHILIIANVYHAE